MNGYRYPNEQLILFFTLLVILVVGIVTAGATLCLLPVFVIIASLIAYQMNMRQHAALMQRAMHVTQERAPELYQLAKDCARRIKPGKISLYVVPNNILNAYTFGISDPKGVVLYSPLFKVMDKDELKFIIGHEFGHAALGHAWLNTMLGGMAGVPMGFGGAVISTLAFRWWNRACEYSADRAGLLACGDPNKAVSALVKLVAHNARSQEDLQRALAIIDKEDDSFGNQLRNTLSTHPMTIDRIERMQDWVKTGEYRRWQEKASR